jgi:DNA mismatch endonuclease (patch repair protein)
VKEDLALRSRIMRAVKGRDTGPELAVRRMAHGLGYRYRLHRSDLPAKPDLVFASRRKVILVHGCFWHGHGCKFSRVPKSNREYWLPKLERNKVRDAAQIKSLRASGWGVLVVWECKIKNAAVLMRRLRSFLA